MGERPVVRKFLLPVCLPVSLHVIFFFFLASAAGAGIVDELKKKQAEIETVSALFMQEKHTKLLTKPIRSTGRFFYKQPGMIRWEYGGSTSMQVMYNGKELWLYYPELKEADSLSGIPQYSSLMHFDISSLSRDYAIAARKEKNVLILRLAPKTKGPVRQIEMEFNRESSFPGKITLVDSNDEETVITFRDARINREIEDALFNFVPPEGVTVRERTLK
ncbi:MAG: outer membrane lipoprotein carrier protein LolA [Nitrospirota bacterium]|nr:outer membrane lipoprotein carrier protein LolA [Nitrospirota bacterium]